MKIRNEENKKIVSVIDSRIKLMKEMKPQISRQNGNVIRELNMILATHSAIQALYKVREEVANSMFKIDLETVSEMIKIKIQNNK